MQQRRQRRGLIIGLLSIGLLAGVALTAHPAQAVDAVGPYYPLPSWAQSLPAATRFVVLTNWNSAAVLDKETGLVWERSPASSINGLFGARILCSEITTGNRVGWRLPFIHELASLIHPSVASPGPTLPPGHPFLTVLSASYWSATTDVDNSSFAWEVNFNNGVVNSNIKTNGNHAWCVRGGADTY